MTYLSEEVRDLKALTPAMFLHGIGETGTPDIDIVDTIDLKSEFKRRQEIMEHLRSRFRKEYLSQLVSRGKVKESRKLEVGDVVLIGDDLHKRLDWPLARIESLIPGRDGIARVAILKTKDGTLKRPIQRVFPLEMHFNRENDADEWRGKMVNVSNNDTGVDESRSDSRSLDLDPADKESEKQTESEQIKTRSGRIVKKTKFD